MSTLIVLLGALAAYGTGFAHAVLRRANKDYKTTKAAVPVLRKGYWAAFRDLVKVGFWVVLAVVALCMWAWHSATHPDNATHTAPSPSISASHH